MSAFSGAEPLSSDKDGDVAAAVSAALDGAGAAARAQCHRKCDFAVTVAESLDPCRPTVITLSGLHSAQCHTLRHKMSLPPGVESKAAELVKTGMFPSEVLTKVCEFAATLQVKHESRLCRFAGLQLDDHLASRAALLQQQQQQQQQQHPRADADQLQHVRRPGASLASVVVAARPSGPSVASPGAPLHAIDLTIQSPPRPTLTTAAMLSAAPFNTGQKRRRASATAMRPASDHHCARVSRASTSEPDDSSSRAASSSSTSGTTNGEDSTGSTSSSTSDDKHGQQQHQRRQRWQQQQR